MRRRFVVVGLVLLSLTLLTVSFRSSALDPVEGFGASVLRPFEVGANKVARPFRDAASWTHGIFNAKAQNRKLTKEIEEFRRENAALKGARSTNAVFAKLLHYVRSPSFPKDYGFKAAKVLTSPSALNQSITILGGTNDGIAFEDVVVTNDGLVGTVTKVFATVSRVTLITDPLSAVRAVDEQHQSAIGILDHGSGGTSLVLDEIGKDKTVNGNDEVITAGSQTDSNYPSLYPSNIPIGTVTSVFQRDTEIDKDIEVQPFVDFSSLETVLVLIPLKGASTNQAVGTTTGTQKHS